MTRFDQRGVDSDVATLDEDLGEECGEASALSSREYCAYLCSNALILHVEPVDGCRVRRRWKLRCRVYAQPFLHVVAGIFLLGGPGILTITICSSSSGLPSDQARRGGRAIYLDISSCADSSGHVWQVSSLWTCVLHESPQGWLPPCRCRRSVGARSRISRRCARWGCCAADEEKRWVPSMPMRQTPECDRPPAPLSMAPTCSPTALRLANVVHDDVSL